MLWERILGGLIGRWFYKVADVDAVEWIPEPRILHAAHGERRGLIFVGEFDHKFRTFVRCGPEFGAMGRIG
jgi:hypothetical protein